MNNNVETNITWWTQFAKQMNITEEKSKEFIADNSAFFYKPTKEFQTLMRAGCADLLRTKMKGKVI